MPKIFISYGRADMAFARQLVDQLRTRMADVWIDIDNIHAGDHWGHKISDCTQGIGCFVTNHHSCFNGIRNVDDEWRFFRDLKKPIIPILREQTEVSWGLNNVQYVDYREDQDQERAFRQLLTALNNQALGFNKLIRSDEHEPLPQEQQPLEVSQDTSPLYRRKPPLVQFRAEYNRPEDMIDNAQKILWISGISVNRVAAHIEHFSSLLNHREGCVWFLLIDPACKSVIRETSEFVKQDPKLLKNRLNTCLGDMKTLKNQFPNQIEEPLSEEIRSLLKKRGRNNKGTIFPQVEIRTLKFRPSVGYFISDPHLSDGIMTIAPYFYHIDKVKSGVDRSDPVCEPPFLHLSNRAHPEWYRVYLHDFIRMWQDAAPIPK